MRKKGIKWILAGALAGILLVNGVLFPEEGGQARAAKITAVTNKTREEAAVWACKEMEKQGAKVQKELLKKVKEEKRISDINRVQKKNREAVFLAYHWGIMGGYSNGAYSKNRSFQGEKKITSKEWKEVKERVKNPQKRLKLSPDGQLCRSKNLPSNYKKFPYILDSYPNRYYEGDFDYEAYIGKYTEGKDYIDPVHIEKAVLTNSKTSYPMKEIRGKYEDAWKQRILQNLKTRLNVDYRTVSKDYKWLNQLQNTYYIYNDIQMDMRKTREIEEYIEKIKKNKVIIKGTVDMDSSTLYRSIFGYFMRAHIKFKVVSAEKIPENQTELIFGDHVYFKNLKKGVWREAIVDIGLGTANGYSDGFDFGVVRDNLVEP